MLGPTSRCTTFGATAGAHRNRAARRHDARSPRCGPAQSARPCSPSSQPRSAGARGLALDHRADGDAVRHHRLRRAHPRLRLPLAGDPGARSRPHPRDRAPPHRYRAQPRPLRPVGLGPRARPGVLVAFDVRDPRPASRRTSCSTFGEVSALVHPDDINLYELATQIADAKVQSIDHAFRMRHADGHWMWLRARCELARQDGEARPASDRHRRRHHRAEERWSSTPWRPTCGCATPSRPFRKPSCCGTPTTGWCCAIRTSRSCTTCPTRRSRPARPTRRSSPPAKSRSCAPRVANDDAQPSRRPHLRSPTRRRTLDAYQRAAHQGRRLCLGRHRHHQDQAARAEADRQREAADRDHRRPAQFRSRRWNSRPSSSPISPKNTPRKRPAPRTPTRPSRNSSPI